jgi:hypothetical protein
MRPFDVDTRVKAEQIEAHHRRCGRCRSLYEAARRLESQSAVDVWRREFWACWSRLHPRRPPS